MPIVWFAKLLSLHTLQQRSVQHYEQAADYFKGEESTSSANKCMLKVAQYAAQLEDYEKAIQIYEQVGPYFVDDSLSMLFLSSSLYLTVCACVSVVFII